MKPGVAKRVVRSSLAGCVAGVAWLVSNAAIADTPVSVWQRARDPESGARYAIHRAVSRELAASHRDPWAKDAALRTARAMLELAKAESSPDVLLRFDLGEVYHEQRLYERAAKVLTAALALAPDHPGAENAQYRLAFCYAMLGRPEEERDAYAAYLARASDPLSRANALLNLAEAEMNLDHLPEAIDTYREAVRAGSEMLRVSGVRETEALAVWGLAVALDRSGEYRAARIEVERALELDPGMFLIGAGEHVFFVPAYERLWYLGLGAMELARKATDPSVAGAFWRRAEAHWREYIEQSQGQGRWASLARKHHAEALARVPKGKQDVRRESR